MKNKFLKCGLAAAAMATSFLPMTALAADNTVTAAGTGTIPVTLTVAATPINATVPTSVAITVPTNSTEGAIASNYTIANKAAVGVLEVKSITATPATGWTLAAKTENFANMNMNTKKMYLGVGVGTDAVAPMTAAYTPTDNAIAPTATKAIKFEAKTAPVSTALNATSVASVVVTVAQK